MTSVAFTLSGESGDAVTVSISNTDLLNGANTIGAEFDFNSAITLTGGTADLKTAVQQINVNSNFSWYLYCKRCSRCYLPVIK